MHVVVHGGDGGTGGNDDRLGAERRLQGAFRALAAAVGRPGVGLPHGFPSSVWEEHCVLPLLARFGATTVEGTVFGLAPGEAAECGAIDTTRFDGGALPPYMYPRSDLHHAAFVPAGLPFPDRVSCVPPAEADGVVARAGWSKCTNGPFMHLVSAETQTFGPALKDDAGGMWSLKVDGTRFMLCFERPSDDGIAYLVDRSLHVWRIDGAPRDIRLNGTILDVEVVNGGIVVLDAIMAADCDVRPIRGAPARLTAAAQPIDILIAEPEWRLVCQNYRPPSAFFGAPSPNNMLQRVRYAVVHDEVERENSAVDGLVYTPFLPYVQGTNYAMLKWKPPHTATIDLVVGSTIDPADVADLPPGGVEPGAVIEVAWADKDDTVADPWPKAPGPAAPWRFVRTRPDRVRGNPPGVVARVERARDVTLEMLFGIESL